MNHVILKPASFLLAMGLLVGATTASALNHSAWQKSFRQSSGQTEVLTTASATEREKSPSANQRFSSQTNKSTTKRRIFRKR